jgi:hypothetical protein
MPWKPIALNPSDFVHGKFIKGTGFCLVNIEKRLIDAKYLFPNKYSAFGECARRNGKSKALLAKMEKDETL